MEEFYVANTKKRVKRRKFKFFYKFDFHYFLLVESARPDAADIHKIVRSGDIQLTEFCLFGELDPSNSKPRSCINSKNRRGMTPLHYAVNNGHLKMVVYLVLHGCNISIKDKDGNTALHAAAAHGHVDIAACLIGNGISKTAKEKVCFMIFYNKYILN